MWHETLRKTDLSVGNLAFLCGLVFIILTVASNVLAADSANLVANPGFELGTNQQGLPLNWSNTYSYFAALRVDSSQYHSGKYSLECSTTADIGYQSVSSDYIAAEGSSPYLLSVWLKSLNGYESVYFGWIEYNDKYEELGTSYFLINGQTSPISWTQFSDVSVTQADTAYVKIVFNAPYLTVGTIWVDDVNLMQLDPQLLPLVGVINSGSAKSLDFGQPSITFGIEYTANAMGPPMVENNINYQQILPSPTLDINFSAFNTDVNGFPLTPMLLEIHYKDSVSDLSTSGVTTHRIFVSSGINFINPDPLLAGYLDKIYYRIADLSGLADNKWKYKQFIFQKSPFQLIRAVDGLFKFRIEMPQDPCCLLPIDYVTLAAITQTQCDQAEQQQRKLNGFIPVTLPPDQPIKLPKYTDLTIFTRDAMRPVYSFTKPASGEIMTNITSFTAKGVIEPLNFAIYSKSGVQSLSFQLSNLVNTQAGATIAANQLSLWHVVYDNTRLAPYCVSFNNCFANLPDRLEPAAFLDIIANTSQRLWLKVAVPPDAQTGVYNGPIRIFQKGRLLQTVNISLNVLPFSLQKPENLNPVYLDPYATVICSDSNEVYRLYNEAGFDPFIYAPWPQFTPIVSAGAITGFDSAHFETDLLKMVTKGFAKSKILVDAESTWQTIYATIYNVNASDIVSDPNLYARLSDSRFVNVFSMAIQKYLQIGSANGVAVIFTVLDEPEADPFRRIAAERLFKIIHDNGAVTAVTYSAGCEQSLPPGIFNIPVNNGYGGLIPPLTASVDFKMWNSSDMGLGFQKFPTSFAYYTTSSACLRNPVYNRFLHGVMAFRTDAKIVAAYAMGDWRGDPYNDFDADSAICSFIYPDFLFAYPTWTGKLLSTMGFEGIREGIKDASYIATLKKLISEKSADPVSIEANNFLGALKQKIDPDYWQAYISKSDNYGFYKPIIADLSDSNNSDDFESFTKIRQKIANYIILLQVSTMFSDDFESGNLKAGGWTAQNSNASVTTSAKYAGIYGAKLAQATWIQKTISTAGYNTIHVKYNRKTSGMGPKEWLYIEWSPDGSKWNALETTHDTTWAAEDFACDIGANNSANFRVRFRTNSSSTSKYAYIDNIAITGIKQ